MKFTKFAVALLACTFVGAAFVGCGSDSSSEAPATTEAATTQAPAATSLPIRLLLRLQPLPLP